MVDLASGTAELPPTDAVLITGKTVKVVVRPSGTEPKLKCYLEARRPPDSSIPLDPGTPPGPGPPGPNPR